MRVCPKCGYRDPLEWKNMPHQLYQEYMTFEEFRELYPKLATALLLEMKIRGTKNVIFDESNGYHLSKAMYVHRCPKYLCKNGKFYHGSSTLEKPKHKDPLQKKLFEKKHREKSK